MYNNAELKQRLIIIKKAGLEDATILDSNYRQLIKQSTNSDEREQFKVLHATAQKRITELAGND